MKNPGMMQNINGAMNENNYDDVKRVQPLMID